MHNGFHVYNITSLPSPFGGALTSNTATHAVHSKGSQGVPSKAVVAYTATQRQHVAAQKRYRRRHACRDGGKPPSQKLPTSVASEEVKSPSSGNTSVHMTGTAGSALAKTQSPAVLVSSYYDHDSLAYGCDWSYAANAASSDQGGISWTIASGSFYDKRLSLWSVSLGE